MGHSIRLRRIALGVILVALVGLTSLGSAYADEYQDVKQKITQLETQIDDLESLVKSLTLQVSRVSDGVITDIEDFRPKLNQTERAAKDNTFEIKKLSGTVARLSESVDKLADLPKRVETLQGTVKDLDAQLTSDVESLANRIGANELALGQLQKSVEQNVAVVEDFKGNLGQLHTKIDDTTAQMESLESRAQEVIGPVNDLQKRLSDAEGSIQAMQEQLPTLIENAQGIRAELARLDDLQSRVAQLQDAVARVQALAKTVQDLESQTARLTDRQRQTTTQTAQMADGLNQLRDQFEGLRSTSGTNAERIQQTMDRLESVEAKLSEHPQVQLTDQVDRLSNKIANVLVETQKNRQQIDQLNQSLADAKAQIKQEVLADVPTPPNVPGPDEIRLQVEEITASQIQTAQNQANSAQSLAIVALLAGLAGVAAALLMQ